MEDISIRMEIEEILKDDNFEEKYRYLNYIVYGNNKYRVVYDPDKKEIVYDFFTVLIKKKETENGRH